MAQFVEFISNHLILFFLFVVILSLLIKNLLADFGKGSGIVDTTEATRLINREDAVILDIRDKAEFKKGHIINALNIPMSELDSRSSELQKYQDQPVIVCCQGGLTSNTATSLLKKSGLSNVLRLRGGLDSWKQANLPLTS